MKVGLLTSQNQMNYGAQLQAYALFHVLGKIGVTDLECVNWWPQKNNVDLDGEPLSYLLKVWKVPALKRMVVKGLFPADYCGFRARRRKARRFLDQAMRQGHVVYREKEDLRDHPYDLFVVGSDQLWNYRRRAHDFCLLGMVDESVRRIAYAVSLAFRELPGEYREEYRSCISRFDAISVREPSAVGIVAGIIGNSKPVQWCVDPTLLLPRAAWHAFVGETPARAEAPYVFIYWLGPLSTLTSVVEGLRKAGYGRMKIVCHWLQRVLAEKLPTFIAFKRRMRRMGAQFVFDAGPHEFVSGIANAELVIADSFHATLFSVIFARPMRIFVQSEAGRERMGSRMLDVAGRYGLHGAVELEMNTEFTCIPEIDFQAAWEAIDVDRATSMTFLVESLSRVGVRVDRIAAGELLRTTREEQA